MLNFDKQASLGPIRIDIASTSVCTYKCCFCEVHSFLITDIAKPTFLNDDIIHNLFVDCKKLGIKELLFSGDGEPLLSKALINEIRQNGMEFKIEVLTNGSSLGLVDDELFRNIGALTISLNAGNGKSHQLTHGYKGENRFNEITDNIERILKFRNASDKIKLNYVITSDNFDELDDFFNLALRWNVSFMARPVGIIFPELSVKELSQDMLDNIDTKVKQYLAAGNMSGKLALSFELLQRALRMSFTKPEGSEPYPCYMGFIQAYIKSDGDVLLCGEGEDRPLGNLNRETLSSIWQKKESLSLRIAATQMHNTNNPVFEMCTNCANVRYHSLAFHSIFSRIPFLPALLKKRSKELNPPDLSRIASKRTS
ncbi:SPASM domain-containing protein [Chloroflexota bacterium]